MLRLKTHENHPHPIKVSSCLQVRFHRDGGREGGGGDSRGH